MSAFMVSKAHIDALIATAVYGPEDTHPSYNFRWYWEHGLHEGQRHGDLRGGENEDEIGRMLWEENLKSIQARYPDDEDGSFGVDHEDIALYHFDGQFRRRVSPVQALKAIDCYEYQSCEHREWGTSNAKAFCDALRHHIIGCLPGYEDAKWEISDPVVASA